MAKIKILPLHEAHKIAAGEVVERPANIAKELIENAIDAGASTIFIYIEDGGKKKIRVVDDGIGMAPEDAQLCFLKHATSKISSIDDVECVTTFGFRGEALASIAAVAQVSLHTKEDSSLEGTAIVVEDGQQTIHTVATNKGTDISVNNLFYNIPARKKFLKANNTEYRTIVQLFQAFCLDYPTIHFKLFSENSCIFNCPPASTIMDRCAQLFSTSLPQQCIEIAATRKDNSIGIEGIISHQTYTHYDRNNIFFFVNKRWVKNQKLVSALLKGYQNVLPYGKFPTACITITIDPTLVDINIHPRKEEVRFLHPIIVEQLIQQTVQQTLENHISKQIRPYRSLEQELHTIAVNSLIEEKQTYQNQKQLPPLFQSPPNSAHTTIMPIQKNNLHQNQNVFKNDIYSTIEQIVETDSSKNIPTTFFTPEEQTEHETIILGQYRSTYIIIERPDGLFLVDQHAAHERILYELFSTRSAEVATVSLLFAHIITLSQQDIETITPYLHILQQNGIGAEIFGNDTLIIQSTPVYLKDRSLNDLVQEMIVWILEYQYLDPVACAQSICKKLHAQMACKAAIKAGDVLTQEQMQQLLKDLAITNNRFTCPHGRPTGFLLSLEEIEHTFKRR